MNEFTIRAGEPVEPVIPSYANERERARYVAEDGTVDGPVNDLLCDLIARLILLEVDADDDDPYRTVLPLLRATANTIARKLGVARAGERGPDRVERQPLSAGPRRVRGRGVTHVHERHTHDDRQRTAQGTEPARA
jgi:hypothetical protein